MRIKTLFTACSLLFCFKSYSETNVSGTITEDQTWSVSGSPYVLTGTLGVPGGTTLSIEAGVRIEGDFDLLVKGKVFLDGTSQDSIYLDQTRLIFKDADLSQSRISYVSFENSAGVQLADESEFNQDNIKNSDTLNVYDSRFTGNSYAKTKGYDSNAKLKLIACQFESSTIKGYYPRSEVIDVLSSFINESTINSDSYNEGIAFYNSEINNSSFTIGCCRANIKVFYSIVRGSTFEGYNDYNLISVENSEIINTSFSLTTGHLRLFNSELSAPANGSIHIDVETLEISNSELNGNGSQQAIRISGNSGINGGNSTITNSTLINYDFGIEIQRFNNLTIAQNNFVDIASTILSNRSSSNIDAMGNYWGTIDTSVIDSKIVDGSDDLNFGFVDYSGFLSEPTYGTDRPGPFQLLFPENGDAVVYTDLNFQWAESLNATPITYTLVIYDSILTDTISGIETESFLYEVEASMFPNRSYNWFVMATDGQDTTVSDTFNFQIRNTPPGSFTLNYPIAGEQVPNQVTSFEWGESTDLEEISYSLFIFDSDSSFSYANLDSNQFQVDVVSNLFPNRAYEWYVAANDEYDTTFSDTARFFVANIPPEDFTIVSPLDSSIFSVDQEITVVWEQSNDLEHIEYTVEVSSEDTSFSIANLGSNYIRVDTLNFLQTTGNYRVSIIAADPYDSTYSETISFARQELNIYDTIITEKIVYDTTLVEQQVEVYDTVFVEQFLYDTIQVVEFDTLIIEQMVFDTVFVTKYDTVIIEEFVFDTTYVVETIYDTIYVSQITGIEYTSAAGEVSIFPNPSTTGTLEVIATNSTVTRVRIFDTNGIKVDQFDFQDSVIQLDAPPGIYFIYFDIRGSNNEEIYAIRKIILR